MRLSAFLALCVLTFAQSSLGALYKRFPCPDSTHTAINPKCCAYYDLADDLQANVFAGACAKNTQQLLRLTFHDAIGFSLAGKLKGHGADGSFLTFASVETTYPENVGLAGAVTTLTPFLTSHPNISAGDLVQFAGAVGLTNCPGAPRVPFHGGRPPATVAADPGLVPVPQQSSQTIFNRMRDAGLSVTDTVNLLASHTVAHAPDVDTTIPAAPLDSTSGQFDSQVFLELLLKGTGFPGTPNNTGEVESPLPADNVLRLQSDFAISRDPQSACQWQSLINNQNTMVQNFASAMLKMSIIGQNPAHLFDCSEAIPAALPKNFAQSAQFPPGKTSKDIQKVCPLPLPPLHTASSSSTSSTATPSASA